MNWRGIALLAAIGLCLARVLWWLARYSSDPTNANGMPALVPGGFLQTLFSGRSRDTTVSAYARQVHEHDLLLDAQADVAMSTVKQRTTSDVERIVVTEERTGG